MSTRDNQNWDQNRFDRQRDLALQAQDAVRVARVYMTATQSAPVEQRIALLRQAVIVLHPLKDSENAVLDVETELVKLNPADSELFDRVSAKLRAYDKSKELAGLLEVLLAPGVALDPETQQLRRSELLDLYANKLNDRGRAAEQLVHLLESSTIRPEWLSHAEELAQNRAWLKVLAPNLARAYQRLNQPTGELAVLNRELEVARGPRLAELRKRLAILRQDFLDDADGALEILEPLVSAEPGDDEMRGRFLELSVTRDRKQEAARRLTRAMTSVHEMAARARIGLDLGRLWQQNDDDESANAAYLDVLRTRADDPAVLAAAEALDALGAPLDAEADRDRLWAVCALSKQPAARRAAAEALLKSCEGEQAVDDLKATALETIVDTAPDRALETLLKLESHYAERRDFQRLIPVLERILAAESAADASYRALLASQRAERLGLLGSLRRDVTDNAAGALSAFTEALSIDPQQSLSIDTLMDWMNNGPNRLEAAAILEPHLRAQGSYAELLVALGARTEFDPSAEHRLEAANEALSLFQQGLVPTDSAAWFCAHGLKAALDGAEEQATQWASALESVCNGNPSVEADGLEAGLGARSITNVTLLGLALRAIVRLIEVQRFEQASARLAEAQKFDPTEPQLLALADVIAQVRGDEPEERLEQVQAAIGSETGDRRVALLTLRASIERSLFGASENELATWLQVIDEDPRSIVAHQALCELYTTLDKTELLEPELRRALASFPAEEQNSVRTKLAELLASQRREPEALELYREVLRNDKVDSESLAHAAQLAQQTSDVELQGQVLQRRVEVAKTRLERGVALEVLGTHLLETGLAHADAIDDYRQALRAYVDAGQIERARALAERLLVVAPRDSETAAVLVHLAFSNGDMENANSYFDTVAHADTRRAYVLLQELEPTAQRAGSLPDLLNWIERLLWLNTAAGTVDSRTLLVQKANWLAAIPERLGEASEVWQSLIETHNDPSDILAYQRYLTLFPDTAQQHEGLRWLFERAVSSAADPCAPLLQWAKTEADDFGDLATAIALCERALHAQSANSEALDLLASLRLRAGAAEGALQALETLRRQTAEPERERVDVKIAQLLAEHLDQPELAFAKLRPLLTKEPNSEAVIQMIIALSKDDRVGQASARVFEELAASWKSCGVEPQNIFNRVAAVARCAAPDSKLWEILEELGPQTQSAEAVVTAYGSAIGYFKQPDVLEQLGKSVVAFADQWAPDASALTDALLRVLDVAPKARWALDRVSFVLSQQGRFG